ncbi:MAG: methyltransferase domain-containing protein [Proteobacteria bacterium]|nr:methyltransferase domain-containing protein [Pseudomonadota bacterium]
MDPRKDWPAYFKAARSFETRPTTRFALGKFHAESRGGFAIDLGCGNGTDTHAMLLAGWEVLGIDASAEGLAELAARTDLPNQTHLKLEQNTLENVRLPACLFLNASFVLPFCNPEHFTDVWERIVAAIQPGGRFAGQFFGPRDSWKSAGYALTHTRTQVEELMRPFQIEMLREDERDGADATGTPKHWHVWHTVGLKK